MVIGTGIDIIEVERVKKAAAKPAFLKMVFTPAEQAYFERFNFEPQTIAGTFAAKEATAKALSVGFRGIKWTDIEVLHDCLLYTSKICGRASCTWRKTSSRCRMCSSMARRRRRVRRTS